MRFLRYGQGLAIPVLVVLSLVLGGWWSLLAVVVSFGLFPLLEMILPVSTKNLDAEQEAVVAGQRRYDYLLYAMVPIQYGLLLLFLWRVSSSELGFWDVVGLTSAMGVACGVLGINVAHELGHRPKVFERNLSKLLLLSTLYQHFYIEHNRGHHKRVATPDDPASARYGESLYRFLPRTLVGSWRSAWQLELKRLNKHRLPVWSLHNEMVRFLIYQGALVAAVALMFGPIALGAFLGASLMGIALLETVNYVEHYGLQRIKLADGHFERVREIHSWNSDHYLGRVILFELTRHSDHHAHAGRPYPLLRHMDSSPQLPTGYPGMVVLAWFPPLFFHVMHPCIDHWRQDRLSESGTLISGAA